MTRGGKNERKSERKNDIRPIAAHIIGGLVEVIEPEANVLHGLHLPPQFLSVGVLLPQQVDILKQHCDDIVHMLWHTRKSSSNQGHKGIKSGENRKRRCT